MQTVDTILALETFFQELDRQHTGALVLDYDGTLAPFCKDRLHAIPYPGVSEALVKIMSGSSTRVVMVTGRPVGELVALLGISPPPEVWGLHGLQHLRPNGECRTYPILDSDLQILAEADAWLDYQGLRHLAEVKKGSIAVHWRGMSPQTQPKLLRRCVRDGAGWPLIAAWSCSTSTVESKSASTAETKLMRF